MIELELREILRRLIAARGMGRRAAMSQAYIAWETVVGVEVARHVRPEFIRRSVLHLVADTGVWAQEVSFARNDILQRLRQAGIPIEDLRLRQGTLPEVERLPVLAPKPRAPAPPPGDIAALVDDPGLRATLERFVERAKRKGDPPAPSHRK